MSDYLFTFEDGLWYAIPKDKYDQFSTDKDVAMKSKDVMVLIEIIRKKIVVE